MLYTQDMTDDQKAFLLRMPKRLYQEVAEWATDDHRTVTGQVIQLLEQLVEERRSKLSKRRN